MIRVLNELTCDDCGHVDLYEQLRVPGGPFPKTCRLEPLKVWLTQYGWSWSDGLRHLVLCPVCTEKRKAKA